MKTNNTDPAKFSSVLESESDVFSDLVKLSGLRPQSDFQHARLAELDFGGSNLSAFNFDFADLRRAKWEGRLSDPQSLQYSLRGSGNDEVRGDDFKDLKTKVHSKSLWAERFFAFRILVENWGVNSDTYDVLARLLEVKNGTYLPLCCFVYFVSSYSDDAVSKAFCVDMANAGRSQANIFRLKRLRRSANQGASYIESVNPKRRYPNAISQNEAGALRRRINRLIENAGDARTFQL